VLLNTEADRTMSHSTLKLIMLASVSYFDVLYLTTENYSDPWRR